MIHLRSAHTRRPICTLRANAHTVRMLIPSLASAVRMLHPGTQALGPGTQEKGAGGQGPAYTQRELFRME